MSAHGQVEIAASPEVVRRAFLDFTNIPKLNDPRLQSLTPLSPSEPLIKGSKIRAEIGGLKSVVTVTENTPRQFSWYGNAFYVFSGNHVFEFLESSITPGHTTFVNREAFGKLLWVIVKVGVLNAQANFQDTAERVKRLVEGGLEE